MTVRVEACYQLILAKEGNRILRWILWWLSAACVYYERALLCEREVACKWPDSCSSTGRAGKRSISTHSPTHAEALNSVVKVSAMIDLQVVSCTID